MGVVSLMPPTALSPGKSPQHPCHRSLVWSHCRPGHFGEQSISPTGPHSEPNYSSPLPPPQPQSYFKIRFRKLSSYRSLDLLIALFPSGFTTEILYALTSLSIPTTCTLILSSFICSSPKHSRNIILTIYVVHVIFEMNSNCFS
jgi:hypothetical protein